MKLKTKRLVKKVFDRVSHVIGRISGRYYFEDYTRVYPDQLAFNRIGMRRAPQTVDVNNYLVHRKFYEFAAQFVRDKTVADVGCGSGYGCEILKHKGARRVVGCDLSRSAICFALKRFQDVAEFTIQGITDLSDYGDDSFDVTVSSEVLEHIKEYGMEGKALAELKRVTRKGGIVIVGTPNTELIENHGFSFSEIKTIFSSQFNVFCVFENALVPFNERKQDWLRRLAENDTGTIISESINLDETPFWVKTTPEVKVGLEAGQYRFHNIEIDTTLLHNPYSWIVVAQK